LQKFLSVVCSRPAAELVDLGPVVGANVAFLGERVGCKIHVEDLYADLDRHAQQGVLERFPEFLGRRLSLPAESIDAVLCWDVFDYLEPPAASVLARELMRLLRPAGVLLAFFGTSGPPRDSRYTKYVIEDEEHLRYRAYGTASSPPRPLQNRDIVRLFDRLEVSDSVLLKSGVREMLFRKPVRRS
jgi:SAM-dependent methyltransferase